MTRIASRLSLGACQPSLEGCVNAFLKKHCDMLIRRAKLMVIALLLAGCTGAPVAGNGVRDATHSASGSASTSSASTSSASAGSASSRQTTAEPIVLEGAPPGSVMVRTDYTFQPPVLQGGTGIRFSIDGQPPWT